MPRHVAPKSDSGPENTAQRSPDTTDATSGPRLTLRPTPLATVQPDEPLAVVAPRLRNLLLAAVGDVVTVRGATNVLRWGRPLWSDDPTAVSPVAFDAPEQVSIDCERTQSLVVESRPNYAHSLRAERVDDAPPGATTLSLDCQPAGTTRLLVRLVQSGRLRVPVCSRTYRLLAGDCPDTAAERHTLCYLRDGSRTYRIDREPTVERPQPMSALVVTALPTAGDAAFTLALPEVSATAARPFWVCARGDADSVGVRSLPDEARDIADAYDYALTPGGAYEVSLSSD